MANAKQCDRCGKCYPTDSISRDFEDGDDAWRFTLVKDCHPYSVWNLDLCSDCRKSLYSWLMEGKKLNG